MRTIHKFTFDLHNERTWSIDTHEGAKVVLVHTQGSPIMSLIRIWVEVDTDLPIVTRHFHIAGTGHEVPKYANGPKHVGSCVDGIYVWHVFEK